MTTTILVVETVVLVLLTVLVAGLLRSHAEILRRLHALGAGLDADAPGQPSRRVRSICAADASESFVGRGRSRRRRPARRRDARRGRRARGIARCSRSSRAAASRVTGSGTRSPIRAALDLPDDIRLVVVTKDAEEESISALRKLAPADVPVVMSSAAWTDYRVPGLALLRARRRAGGPGARRRHRRALGAGENLLRQAADDASDDGREVRIDRELLAHGIAPGDPSLYRTAERDRAKTSRVDR